MLVSVNRSPGFAGAVALLLGMGSAAVSAYWLLGGSALLDTVGGEIERWGRERGAAVLLALAGVVLVKLCAAVIPAVVAVSRRGATTLRLIGWTAAGVLVVYGGVLTVVGLLVQADAIHASVDADPKALAWHAYLWDPWFLLWGVALAAHLRRSSTSHRSTSDIN